MADIGVIGGSGLYRLPGVDVIEKIKLETPFGDPSAEFVLSNVEGREVVFMPRHGVNHQILPGELNFRANIWGMKKLGVQRLIAVSAVGSMKEEIKPGDFVIVDQFLDRTRGRISTFFGDGCAAHVHFADPTCPELGEVMARAAAAAGKKTHRGGTYVCIEGPQFSTRAESQFYRSLGVTVIGMTNLQEAKLAREAELCYQTVALVTDYDCWHEAEDDVSVDAIIKVLNDNADAAGVMIKEAVKLMPPQEACNCDSALKNCIMTHPGQIPPKTRERLSLLVDKYLGG